MNAEFFALAFLAALNPKLLALDLLLIENRRPRAMFLCLLLGGMTVALTIGLLDVLVFRADAIKAQGKVSAGVDLALGLLLLAAEALLKHTQDWLLGHAVQLMATIALLLGAYLAVSGLVRLS